MQTVGLLWQRQVNITRQTIGPKGGPAIYKIPGWAQEMQKIYKWKAFTDWS